MPEVSLSYVPDAPALPLVHNSALGLGTGGPAWPLLPGVAEVREEQAGRVLTTQPGRVLCASLIPRQVRLIHVSVRGLSAPGLMAGVQSGLSPVPTRENVLLFPSAAYCTAFPFECLAYQSRLACPTQRQHASLSNQHKQRDPSMGKGHRFPSS